MQKSVLDAKHFHDEEAAYAYLESKVWPTGPVCPKCGGVERISKMMLPVPQAVPGDCRHRV